MGSREMIVLDNLALSARKIKVMPITPEIAYISSSHKAFVHHDPADRMIAATTIYYKSTLVTCDGLWCSGQSSTR